MLPDGKEITLTAFADGMKTFVRDKMSTDKLLKAIDNFGLCSGLKLNRSKLEAIYLSPPSAHFATNLEVSTSVKILGIFFSYSKKEATRLNFESISESLKKRLNLWKWRHLTIIGRIQIVKTFAISKFQRRNQECKHNYL